MPQQLHACRTCVVTMGSRVTSRRIQATAHCNWLPIMCHNRLAKIEFCRLSFAVDMDHMLCCRIWESTVKPFAWFVDEIDIEIAIWARRWSPQVWWLEWWCHWYSAEMNVICYEIPIAIRKHCAPFMASLPLPTSFFSGMCLWGHSEGSDSVSLCKCSYPHAQRNAARISRRNEI